MCKEKRTKAWLRVQLLSSVPCPFFPSATRAHHLHSVYPIHLAVTWTSLVAPSVKKSAYSGGDLGSIYGSGRSPGEGSGYHSSILAWRQRSLAGYSPWCHKESDTTKQLTHHDMEDSPSSHW